MRLNLPTALTFLRIILIPLFVLVFYLPYDWAFPVSAMIFAVAGFTDWLDGYLARRWNQMSAFGAFLDPVADKLMVAAALIMLVDKNGGLLLVIPAVVIVGREITVSALREWMAEIGQRSSVAVSAIGKIKTALQMFAIWLLLYHQPIAGLPTRTLGMMLIYLAAGLTLWSMVMYLRVALRNIDLE
ncbi:MAG: CDP-diacylglycerol--glycerol-3-phosphate 3-phosphatidyltransferase [Gammaproteobacteria bacterium]